LRVPEDDDDFLPPLPDQNLGAGVNQVIVVSDPRDVGEPSLGFERAERDFFCEGPTLDWESDSAQSSDESSRGPGDYGVWESDWESEGEDSDPHPPLPPTNQHEASSSSNILMVRKGKSRRSKTSRTRDVPSSDESESEGEGEELLLEMPPGWLPPVDHSEPQVPSGLDVAGGSPSTPILAIVAPPPSVFSPSLPFANRSPRAHMPSSLLCSHKGTPASLSWPGSSRGLHGHAGGTFANGGGHFTPHAIVRQLK